MKHCISQITTMTSSTPADFAAFSTAGWGAVELTFDKVKTYLKTASVADLRDLTRSSGLKLAAATSGGAPSGKGLLLGSGNVLDAYLAELKEQLELCVALGIDRLVIGADKADKNEQPSDWLNMAAQNLTLAGEMAKTHGLTLAFGSVSMAPPIGPFVVDSFLDSVALIEKAGHPNVGINLDLFHYYRGGGTPEQLRQSGKHVVHLHYCDIQDMPIEQLGDGNRAMPGDGVLDFEAIRSALAANGYEGYWSLELLSEELWALDPTDVARIGKAAAESAVTLR